ncbi:MAG TPA: right-handed parallel beta-helix repeat-containing protein [Nitrososphaeraceae archaeon]|nr:right-handed parallel beta-helix repeat-containing protein [Nitrososphaeraceae archaeon]
MNKVIVTITKTSAIFLTIVLLAGIFALYISPSFITVELQAQKEESEIEEEKCISYNKSEKLISISCKYADFADISKQITDPKILKRESTITTTNTTDNNEKVWLLNAGISVEKDATLNIDSGEVTWLKRVPSKNTPNAITVDGILKVDSVKITSWNPETNDYIYFSDAVKYDELQYKKELRPYIKVNTDATGPTVIQNSELAYLGYSCSGCGGVTFNGGENSILKNNDIHHIYKGFYSKEMGHMLIEGNRVYGNDKYGIDPHTGTHNMTIRNNTVYDDGNSGIICSLDCYNIIIEDNEVYNNGINGTGRGIAFSINMFDSIARNNYVHHQNIGIGISNESHDNKVYNNKILDSKVGINTIEKSSNNNVYNNTILNTINGIIVNSGASDNTFEFNKIVNATESGILNVKGDSGTTVGNNTLENNKLIDSKVNTTSTTSTSTIGVDDNNDDDKSEKKEKGKKKK